jgi:uncharacterized delta-60 repeat protein
VLVAGAALAVLVTSASATGVAGDLDTSFGSGGVTATVIGANSSGAYGVTIQSDDKTIAFGQSDYAPGKTGFTLARYRTDGTLDPTFGSAGVVTTAIGTYVDQPYAAAVQSDGKIVAAGYTSLDSGDTNDQFAIVRYLSADRPTRASAPTARSPSRSGSQGAGRAQMQSPSRATGRSSSPAGRT